jgi:hypothetical protein
MRLKGPFLIIPVKSVLEGTPTEICPLPTEPPSTGIKLKALAIGVMMVVAGAFAGTLMMQPRVEPIRKAQDLDIKHIPQLLKDGTIRHTTYSKAFSRKKERCLSIDDKLGLKYCGPLKYKDIGKIQSKAAWYLMESESFDRLQSALDQMAMVNTVKDGEALKAQALIARYSRSPNYELHAMILGMHMCRSTTYIPDQYSVSRYWQQKDDSYGIPGSGVAMLWDLTAVGADRIQFTAGLSNLGAVDHIDARYPSCNERFEDKEDDTLKALRAQDHVAVTKHFNKKVQDKTTGEILANLSLDGFLGLAVYPHEQVTDADYVLQTIQKFQENAWADRWLINMYEIANREHKDRGIPHPAEAFDTVYVYDYSLGKPQLVLAKNTTHLGQLVRQSVKAYHELCISEVRALDD